MKWKRNSVSLCLAVFILFSVTVSNCADDREEVVFYEDAKFDGDRIFLGLAKGCYNMEKAWDNRISSVDTQGHCIIGWDQLDCRGLSVKLTTGGQGAADLARLRFDDAISSISVCPSDPSRAKSRGPSGIQELDIWRVGLTEHNNYRRKHGVPDLHGDVDLHQEAQGHADYLARNNKFEASPGTQYGENLATSYKKDKLDAIRDVVKRWYDKIDFFDFRDPESNKRNPKSGQFSSVIWQSTTNLGVGVAYNEGEKKWVVVCMYSPPATMNKYRENVPPPLRAVQGEAPQFIRTAMSNVHNSRRHRNEGYYSYDVDV